MDPHTPVPPPAAASPTHPPVRRRRWVGIVIAISGPSMLIAWLKLRQRSLGPILDASGWAINGRMKVN
ncbi:hypothetical protein, partial [Variovorax paradoxus]|uniref:hypothetical protein n=1 Tax=Variovorax paradoxus TaxID=34073 RepID=UPI001ABC1835